MLNIAFWTEGEGVDCSISDFRAQSARTTPETPFQKILKILKTFTKLLYQIAMKLNFKAIFQGPIFVPARSKNLNFSPDVQNHHFSIHARGIWGGGSSTLWQMYLKIFGSWQMYFLPKMGIFSKFLRCIYQQRPKNHFLLHFY